MTERNDFRYKPPLIIPPRRQLKHGLKRPFNTDKDCVIYICPEHGTYWYDYSGYSNHGSIVGATAVHTGRYGQAYSFDGVNDRIAFLTPSELQVLTDFSFDMWIWPITIGGDGTARDIVFRWGGGTGWFKAYHSALTAGRILFYINDDDGDDVEAFNDLPNGANHWAHLACVREGDNIQVFIDGVGGAIETEAGTFTKNTNLGLSSGSNDFHGLIDEFRFYTRALQPWEIRALYEAGRPGE